MMETFWCVSGRMGGCGLPRACGRVVWAVSERWAVLGARRPECWDVPGEVGLGFEFELELERECVLKKLWGDWMGPRQDTERKRRWAATPPTSPEEGQGRQVALGGLYELGDWEMVIVLGI